MSTQAGLNGTLERRSSEQAAEKAELELLHRRALDSFAAAREAFAALQLAHQEQRYRGSELIVFQVRAGEVRELIARLHTVIHAQHEERGERLRAFSAPSTAPAARLGGRPAVG